MFFEHIYEDSLAQASYIIGCQENGAAVVIDPKRDVDTYLDVAEKNNLKITHIFETHIHADFLSGSRELAELTGADIYLSAEGGKDWKYEFPHKGLKNGDVIELGNLKFEVIHTPGHTPESLSFLLTDQPATDRPVMIFTGDFVFVGDVGRPDLLEKAAGMQGTQEEGAEQMYESLKDFKKLSDFIQVWPGHGAGSACGKSLGAVPSSTVGYEKIRNWALQYAKDKKGFIKELLSDQPEPPKYFAKMKELNKEERPLLTEVPKLKKISGKKLTKLLKEGVTLVDTRGKKKFAQGYIPGSLNIQGNKSFPTWAGWFLDYDKPFILLADKSNLEDLTRKLMRVGLDNVAGYIPSVEVYTKEGGKLETEKIIGISKFKKLKKQGVTVVDVRNEKEYREGHIKGAKNVFVGTMEENLDKIDKKEKTVIHCQSGTRSAIAYSVLAKHGYKNVVNYSGGMKEWKEKGNSTVE